MPEPSWERADSLINALDQNGKRLGRLVRNTSGIDNALYCLQRSDNREGEGERGKLRRKRWYLSILQACPRLRTVHLLFPPKRQDLVDLSLALSSGVPPSTSAFLPLALLREIAFPYDFDDDLPAEFDYTHVFDFLSSSSIRSLKEVHFGDVSWLRGGPRSTAPCFPFPIESLTIHSFSRRLAHSAQLFPKDPSNLADLTFSGTIDPQGTDLLSLSSLVGSNLESLSLSFVPSSPKPRLSTYSQPLSSPRIPLRAFNTFPNLHFLDLHNTHGPSLRFLETLARTSPLLLRISCRSSRWVADSDPLSTDPDEIFPQRQILLALLKFRHLRSFYLGILPAVDPGRYEAFSNATRESGIRVRFDLCEEEEEEE